MHEKKYTTSGLQPQQLDEMRQALATMSDDELDKEYNYQKSKLDKMALSELKTNNDFANQEILLQSQLLDTILNEKYMRGMK